ncbi:hypothetical protein E3O44_00580 [Cryobacterium algoricola]|uniref:DUF998 domain-containing protein n=1 Tax=Cryobacterium algoricola TaxID=1259183 RepID=A0ABY2IHW3_9MICO|nr:hypothetical protein [Cryobacterium algoricola]TFB90147.1 hypothetical protein E3O44_00580 [Cryobacterium algoricola]
MTSSRAHPATLVEYERTSAGGRSEVESGALIAAAVAALAGLLGAVVIFGGNAVGLAGTVSVGGLSAQIAGLIGFPVFGWSYVRFTRHSASWRSRARVRRILDTLGLSLTGAAMAGLLISSVYAVFQLAFRELLLDPFAATLFVTLTVAASTFALFLLAAEITTTRLASLLGLFLAAGVFSSMLTAADPRWWQANFSALGMGGASSAYAFNLTILLAGLVMTTLADYLTLDLRSRQSAAGSDLRGVPLVRIIIIVVGVALIGVGLVPVDVSFVVHNTFATSAVVGFVALIVLVPLVLKDLPRSFIVTTTVFVLAIGGAVLLWYPIGYYNLTALELVAVLIVFAWFVLFVRNASVVAPAPDAAAPVSQAAPVAALSTAASAAHPLPGMGRGGRAAGWVAVGGLIGFVGFAIGRLGRR